MSPSNTARKQPRSTTQACPQIRDLPGKCSTIKFVRETGRRAETPSGDWKSAALCPRGRPNGNREGVSEPASPRAHEDVQQPGMQGGLARPASGRVAPYPTGCVLMETGDPAVTQRGARGHATARVHREPARPCSERHYSQPPSPGVLRGGNGPTCCGRAMPWNRVEHTAGPRGPADGPERHHAGREEPDSPSVQGTCWK